MRFFYSCNRQLLVAITAAYIYLQKFPQERIPSIDEILKISEYDQLISGDFGVPYFIGKLDNCRIYVINFNSDVSFALQAIRNILIQRNVDFSKWQFFNVSEARDSRNIFIQTGEWLARKQLTRSLGKYLAAVGIRKNYWKIWERVHSIREQKM